MIRPVASHEAERLYELKRACFSEAYLGYSVFRHPRSARHLGAMLRSELAPRHPILVAGDFEGYVQGAIRDGTAHLDFIGVHPDRAGQGLGNRLLDAFVDSGGAAGATRITLDAFAGNSVALGWYERRGYAEVARTPMATLDLRGIEPSSGLTYDALEVAQAEENARGFGFTPFSGAETPLALVAFDSLRVRIEADAERVVRGLRADFPDRSRLVVAGVEMDAFPTLDRQISIRMEKRL